ncbi:hypothetical protein UC8_29320 [Roseimaritima ulvae]|uniref:EF-hand domain-containing protein n=2 Tax=Roseimaritima ulvae TaxID=980254 RepID=A0A5B9QPM9_9BACT|nr:hypothetical protein UC8_29320 [Roseimaritima ulvae]
MDWADCGKFELFGGPLKWIDSFPFFRVTLPARLTHEWCTPLLQCFSYDGNLMPRPLAITILAIAAALPAIASAQPPGGGRGPGGGSPLEMISQSFDMADANRDGQLTKAELTAAISKMSQQRGGFQGRPGGPPPGAPFGQPPAQRGQAEFGGPAEQGGFAGPGGHQAGPPSSPGQVLPEFVAESLNLTERQQKRIAALQAEVDRRLAAVLTDEQEQQLKNPPPPPAHGEGRPPHQGPGEDAENDRPQRPF